MSAPKVGWKDRRVVPSYGHMKCRAWRIMSSRTWHLEKKQKVEICGVLRVLHEKRGSTLLLKYCVAKLVRKLGRRKDADYRLAKEPLGLLSCDWDDRGSETGAARGGKKRPEKLKKKRDTKGQNWKKCSGHSLCTPLWRLRMRSCLSQRKREGCVVRDTACCRSVQPLGRYSGTRTRKAIRARKLICQTAKVAVFVS